VFPARLRRRHGHGFTVGLRMSYQDYGTRNPGLAVSKKKTPPLNIEPRRHSVKALGRIFLFSRRPLFPACHMRRNQCHACQLYRAAATLTGQRGPPRSQDGGRPKRGKAPGRKVGSGRRTSRQIGRYTRKKVMRSCKCSKTMVIVCPLSI
jgi:hypothetical protein